MEKYVHKVRYYETDQMGIAHHSNYVRWMEEARIDFFDQIGLSYKYLESTGIYSPVVGLECGFKAPTAFEDEVEIEVRIEEFRGVKLILSYQMTKLGTGELVLTGRSSHCFADMEGRPIILKKAFPELDAKLRAMAAGQQDDSPAAEE